GRHAKAESGRRFCPSHDSVDKTFRQVAIGVNSAVPQKWPVRARDVDFAQIHLRQQNLLLLRARLRQNLAAGARDKALSPKLEPVSADWRFRADAIHGRNVATVRHRVASMTDLPRPML